MITPYEVITDVAIDMDNVLYPFSHEFHRFCSKALKRSLTPPVKWEFYEDWGLNETEFNALLDEAVHAGVFVNGEPAQGDLAAWNILRDIGVRIHVLTARPPSSWADTTWWLDNWKFKADTLHFVEDKGIFAYIVEDYGVLLDDAPKYLTMQSHYDNYITAAFDQPWNRHLNLLNRFSTLMDFTKFVQEYNLERKWQKYYAQQS